MVHDTLKLNEAEVKTLPVPAKGSKIYGFAGAVIQGSEVPRGFGVRVTATGVRSFVLRYFLKGEHLGVIGQYPDWKPATAVREAREWRQKIDRGEDPLSERRKEKAAESTIVKALCEEWLAREGKKLRTGEWRRQVLERLVYPEIGKKQIEEVKRSDVVKLLDKIEDENGPVMADRTLACIRKVFSWHESRSDDFRSPIVRGMSRTKSQERARERTLTDDELRAIWRAAQGPFGAFIKFTLLTGARRSEAAEMPRAELAGADWTLPKERNKTKVDLLRPLSPAALNVLPGGDSPFMFSTDGVNPISGFSKFKVALDKASGVTGWTLHDCRRTSRTLLSRAGVNADVAERCLGHVIGGVRGVYDRWEFRDEKAAAYKALAALIDRIVNPPAGNVEDLGERRRKGAA